MNIKFRILSITFANNAKIELQPTGITIIVGPNNAGKTLLIKEIHDVLQNGNGNTERRKILKNIQFEKIGSKEDYKQYLQKINPPTIHNGIHYSVKGVNIEENNALQCWENASIKGLGNLLKLHCSYTTTANRHHHVSSPPAIDPSKDSAGSPIHELLLDEKSEEIEKKLSLHVKKAFGNDLILDRSSNKNVNLHFGETPQCEPGEDRASPSYVKKLANLPKVYQQGDGIKSFIGCILLTMISSKFITLFDEPEISLHPPQAKLLGTLLSKEHKNNQLIFSAHRSDILRCALESNVDNVNIIRITRKEDKNEITQLDHKDIATLWRDPLLRFSNMLDGLFHENVAICEAEADCKFFAELTTQVYNNNFTESSKKLPDIHFMPSGGKGKITKISQAFLKIKQNTIAIFDFDFLKDKRQVKETYEIHGGTWNAISKLYDDLVKIIYKIPEKSAQNACEEIQEILNDIKNTGKIEKHHGVEIKNVLDSTKSWHMAKKLGVNSFSSEKEKELALQLLAEFSKVNIWIIPVGELESFDNSTGRNKKGHLWVEEALKKDCENSSNLSEARCFITSILEKNALI